MRVVQVITNLSLGGAQRFVLDLTRELNGLPGVQCTVHSLSDQQPFYPTDPWLEIAHDLKYRGTSWRDVPALVDVCRRLRRFIKERQIDIIHTHLWEADWIGSLATLGTRASHFSYLHWEIPWFTSSRPGFRVRKLCLAAALRLARSRLIAGSESTGEYVRRHLDIPAPRVSVVPTGIDTSIYEGIVPRRLRAQNSAGTVFGMIGRLVPEKGHDLAIGAVEILTRTAPDVRLVVAGDGEARTMIEELIARKRLHGHVECIGRITDVRSFYESIDALIQPSRTEVMPLAVHEALASGVPVVASRIGGMPKVVCDGENGFLVDAGSVEELADRMAKFLVMPADKYSNMSNQARATVQQNFSMGVVARQILALYENTNRMEGGSRDAARRA